MNQSLRSAPPMLYHEFMTYFVSYLFDIEKIIVIPHIWAADSHIERNDQKSLIFGIKAKSRMLHLSSGRLKMTRNRMRIHM